MDFPTPPFWFAIAIIRSTLYSFSSNVDYSCSVVSQIRFTNYEIGYAERICSHLNHILTGLPASDSTYSEQLLIILFCIISNLSWFQYSTIEMQYLLKNRFFTIFETIVELKCFTWNIFGVFHSFFFTILFFILTLFNHMTKIICDFFSNYNITSFFHKLYFIVVICILILVWNIDIYL